MRITLAILALLIAGCSSAPEPQSIEASLSTSDTMEIIRSAAEAAPQSVPGEYTLAIKTSGRTPARSTLYLNTELDYRDQRNVTVALQPEAVDQLESKYGENPKEFFINKTILVKGKAQRIRINFKLPSGRLTGKYYYQTHIPVFDASQITLIDAQAQQES